MTVMKKQPVVVLLAIVLFSQVPDRASADIGPKPSADIHVTLNGGNVQDATFESAMLTCEKEDKQFPVPKSRQIPQLEINEYDSAGDCYWKPAFLAHGGHCRNGICHFSYFLPAKFRLAVFLASEDTVYISTEVTRENFSSTFEADLLSDGSMMLHETTSFGQGDTASNIKLFLIALIITAVLELFVASMFVSKRKLPRNILSAVLIANIISLPFVWFVFPLLKMDLSVILAGEGFAFIFEGYFIHWRNKEAITLKKAFLLSILMNLASLIIGGFIFSNLYMFYF